MIEATQEQLRAIAASETAYVGIPRDEWDRMRAAELEAARAVRITWMRRMRLDEEEIAESLRDEPPVSVQEEMNELAALDHLDKITPPVRITWMRRMRLDEEEIAESLRDEPPVSVQEEMNELAALDHLDKITPPGTELDKFAIQY